MFHQPPNQNSDTITKEYPWGLSSGIRDVRRFKIIEIKVAVRSIIALENGFIDISNLIRERSGMQQPMDGCGIKARDLRCSCFLVL